MTALLTNRSFQVFVIILASIGAVSALLATGTLTNDNLLYTVIGFGLGVPVTPVSTTVTPAPAPTAADLVKELLSQQRTVPLGLKTEPNANLGVAAPDGGQAPPDAAAPAA